MSRPASLSSPRRAESMLSVIPGTALAISANRAGRSSERPDDHTRPTFTENGEHRGQRPIAPENRITTVSFHLRLMLPA